jgi:phage baseplate assembly protein V
MVTQPGVVIGVVDDLDDPEGLARVRVTFPHLADEPSNWARLALPMAGASRGTFFRPEKGDEVLVACEHGDIRQPYVVGALWSKTDQPPDQTGAATDNNIRVIVSRSGHRITLDDTQGSERIQITDHTGKQAVVLDGSSITVSADADHVTIKASGDVTVSAGGNLNLTATGTVKISGAQVTINP